ncbi:GNAT superfamily N-acetyltransferase [Methylobacterium sp. BE186]|uniref:GNAT family N-acetyltransferase n=1 Tax=Methylobacterium sp. BE186 TaxID=2817715 RepID=UPI0028595219|nr:GNAT family N-acetyltransferase [Methylobacterium sp. BE186]MDR7036159.1 GNAT superfamily N-acetyltransferase [Methylobacterium sp. BE186]
MDDLAHYSALERLRDGGLLEIRALRPEDRDGLLWAIDHASEQSLYRRFFGARRHFSDTEVAVFLNVDFENQVALVAVADEAGEARIAGGGRYVVTRPGQAEVAFTVIDAFQGRGVGAVLMRHVIAIARRRGLGELIAEVLPDNAPMLKLFERCDLPLRRRREGSVIHVSLQLPGAAPP